jgi:hypothetical protein
VDANSPWAERLELLQNSQCVIAAAIVDKEELRLSTTRESSERFDVEARGFVEARNDDGASRHWLDERADD